MVDRQAELRSSDEAATLPPKQRIHRIRTHEVRTLKGINPKGEDQLKLIRVNRTTDTRIFSERISRSSITQANSRARNAVNSDSGRCSSVAPDDPCLGTKVGTSPVAPAGTDKA